MTDPAIGSSSPNWACLISAGRIPNSNVEPEENIPTEDQRSEQTLEQALEHDTLGEANLGAQMSPYAPVFYPTGSYAAQLLAQEQAAQLHSRILPPRHFEPGMDSIYYSTAVAAGYSPRPNREQQPPNMHFPQPDNDPEPNQNSFGLGMGPSTSGGGRATGTTRIDQDNRLGYRPATGIGIRPIRSPGQELRGAVEAAAGLPPGAIGAEVEAMERAQRERRESPSGGWAPYSYGSPAVIVGDNRNDPPSLESDATSVDSVAGTGTEHVASGATNGLSGHSDLNSQPHYGNMNGNANADDFPPFELFAGQLDHVGIPRDDYIGTLRNLLIRANDMLAPLLQGPFANMSPTQIAAYTTAILETPPLHPSLFMPGNMPRSWAGASVLDLPPCHPHSLTPQDLARILDMPKVAHVGTQTDFRCVCMHFTAGMGPGAAGQGLGGNLLQAGQSTAGPHLGGIHYSYDMGLNATRIGTPVGTPGSPIATSAAFAAGTPIPQATNGPTPHGSLGFWGRPLPMAMHPHQVGSPTQPQFHSTHPHAAFPHPGAHAQMAFSQVTHPHQFGGALRYQEPGGGRFGYRVGHFSPATPCRYGAIGNGRPANRPSNLATPTISLLRPVGTVAGGQVADAPSTINQLTQQRLDEIELELEMQLELDLQQHSDEGSSTDVSNSGTGTGGAAFPAAEQSASRNKNPQDEANNDLSAGSVAGEGGNSTEDGGEGDIEDGEGTDTDSSSSASDQSIVRHRYRSDAAINDQDQESEDTSDSSFEEEEEEYASESESEDGVDEEESVTESESEYDEEDEDASEEEYTEPNTENAESEGFEAEPLTNPAASVSFVQEASPQRMIQEPPPRRFSFGQVQFLGYTLQENTIHTGPSPRLPQAYGAAYLEHGGPPTPRDHLPCAQVMPHILPASFVALPTVMEEIQLGGPVPVASIPSMVGGNLGVPTGAATPPGGSDSQATSSSTSSSSHAESQSVFSGPSTSQRLQCPGSELNPHLLADPSNIFIRAAGVTPPSPPPQMFSLLQERHVAPILFEVGGSRSTAVGPHVVIQNVNGNLGLLNAAHMNGHAAGLGSPNRHLGVSFNAGAPLSPQSLLPPHMRAAHVNHMNMNALNVNMNVNHVGHVSHLNHMGRGLGMGVGMGMGMGVGVGVGVGVGMGMGMGMGVGMGGTHLMPLPLSVIAATRLQQTGFPPNLAPQPPSPTRCYASALNRSISPNSGQNLAHGLNRNPTLSQVLNHNVTQALNHNINQVLNHTVNQALHPTLNPILVPRLNINHTVPGVLEVPTLNGNGLNQRQQPVEVPVGEAQSVAQEAGGELGNAPGATPGPAPLSSPASLANQAAQVVAATFRVSMPRPDAESNTTQPTYASMLQ